jgi:hypothetical protein
MDSAPVDIRIDRDRHRVTIAGKLDGGDTVAKELDSACEQMAKFNVAWLVDASQAPIAKGGVDSWINAVHHHLMECQLRYESSQLANILSYLDTDTYRHPSRDLLKEQLQEEEPSYTWA